MGGCMTETETVELEDKTGTPGLVFLPARDYKFKVDKQTHVIKLPIEGDFRYLADKTLFPGEGKYKLAKEVDGKMVVSLSILIKALFADSKYPDLADNECFVPLAMVISDSDVTIAGKVIEFKVEK